MPDDKPVINPKVHASAVGAGGGSLIGSALADLLTSGLVSLGLNLSQKNMSSIEILVVAGVTILGSYIGGYLKRAE